MARKILGCASSMTRMTEVRPKMMPSLTMGASQPTPAASMPTALQRRARIAGEPELHGIAEPETTGIAVDLHRARLTGLGIELHVREARSHDEQRIAFLERELGRQRAQ